MEFRILITLCLITFIAGCAPSISLEERQRRADAHYKVGVAEFQQGQLAEAFIAFEKAKEYYSDDARIYNALGLVYFERREFQDAISHFQEALKLDPNFADAHNNIGKVHAQLGNWDKAIEEYREALSNPFYRTPELARYNLGEALLEKGDNVNAVKELHETVRIQPNFVPALDKYGIALYRMNRNQEAIKRFKQAIEAVPEFIDPHLNLGIVYMKLNKKSEAIEEFKFVLEHSGNELQRSDAERYLDMLE